MIQRLKDWFHKLMSGRDNHTPDLGRYSWLLSMFVVITAAVYNGYSAAVIDLEKLAQGLSLVVGAHGIALWAKKDTEPDVDKPTT